MKKAAHTAITFRLRPDLVEAAKAIATRDRRSLNAQVEWLIELGLKHWGEESAPSPLQQEAGK